MAPPTSTPSRRAVPLVGQSLSARDGVQAARGMPREPDRIRNARTRANEAMNALQYINQDLQELESHHRGIVEGKDASYAILKQRFTGLETIQKTTTQRLNDKVANMLTLTAEIKKLKQELAGRKAKSAVDEGMAVLLADAKRDHTTLTAETKRLEQELAAEKAKTAVNEDARRRLANVDSENAKLASKAQYLQQELREEMARSAANNDAKRELVELKAKLADMVAGGVKIKTEKDEWFGYCNCGNLERFW